MRSVTSGREALGEALLRIRSGDQSFNGRGVSTDVVEASAKAFLMAINKKAEYDKDNGRLESKEQLIKTA